MTNAVQTGQNIFICLIPDLERCGGGLFLPGLVLQSYNQTLLHYLDEKCSSHVLQGSEMSQKRRSWEQSKWHLAKMGDFNQV